jgi:hypothetical protein
MFEVNPQIPGGSELVREGRGAVGLIHRVVCFPNKFGPTGISPRRGM